MVPASVVSIGDVVSESVTLVSVVLGSVVGAKTVTKLKVVVIIVFLKMIFICFIQDNHRCNNYGVTGWPTKVQRKFLKSTSS